MRSQVFSFSAKNTTTTLLRQALPILVRPYTSKSFLTAPNHVSFLRSKSQTTLLRHNCGLPKHNGLLSFTVTSLRKFTSRAANDAGSVDLPLMQSMEKKIKEQLSAESVTVKDAYGDGRHVR